MKILQYAGIFLIFLTVGTLMATLFTESKYESTHELMISSSDSLIFTTIIDTANAAKWIENAYAIKPVKKPSKQGETNYVMVFLDENNEHTELNQTWIIDTAQQSITITSVIPDRLELSNTISLNCKNHKTTLLKSHIVLDVHGWMNRLLLSGASESLLQRQKSELHAIDSLCQILNK